MYHDELVERCKQGSSLSFKELYLQYSKAMFNTCLRIVNNGADAEDIVQESFIDAFRHIGGFNYQSTFGAWMKRIVINKSINHLRDKKLKVVDIDKTNISELEDEEEFDEANIQFKVEEIKKAVRMLPDGYRTVFTLNAFEGYDYEEISEILKISETTARTQYHRAKKQLLNLINRR
ncbi:MAG TPA: RNA polymerase sigma factor [Chitinophagaceae bacterium]|nr:RNA polymerase sigma factor [Chitinophagaceae bacterium]